MPIATITTRLWIALAILVYFLPTIIALLRANPHKGSVFAINLLLGWTYIGWVIALAMAVRSNVGRYR